mmetsp:Transcript_86537/g.222910  ORF Transcript_86537/g.222910 Transcript_86537/m.222910 type:complete len:670 (-) Transcript_86537:125-2134(-)
MTGLKSQPLSHRNIVVTLLGVGIVYQSLYHVILWRTLERERGEECSNDVTNSPLCTELRLFKSWEEASALKPLSRLELEGSAADDFMGAIGSDWEKLGKELTPLLPPVSFNGTGPSASSSPAVLARDAGAQLEQQRRLREHSDTLPTRRERDASNTAAEFDRLYNATLASLNNRSVVTPWAESLEALQARLERRQWGLASSRRKRAAEFDRLYNDTLAAIHNRSKETPWAKQLSEAQAQMQAELDALPSAQRKQAEDQYEILYQATMAVIHNRSEVTPWGKSLQEDQMRLQAAMDALPHKRRAHAQHAAHNASKPAAKDSDDLLGRIRQLGREMCQEPQRRHRLSCLQFLASPRESRAEAKAAWREELRREEKQKEADLEKRLAELSAGRREWEMALLTKMAQDGLNASGVAGTVAPTPASTSSLRGARRQQQLRWRAVADWSDSRIYSWAQHRKPQVVAPEQLETARWAGKIPVVTCVTAVPSGLHAQTRMQFFIDSFRKQTYEGPHQLVLVYHDTDHQAAELVRKFADGFFIKGVAAHGKEEFPSTTAMRYAAWSSEADVIARWDLYEFHHADRLSMQVRALASASRPGCVLKPASSHEGTESGASGDFWEESLVGEARWMQKYWHPFLGTPERSVLEGAQGQHLVEVQLPRRHHQVADADSAGAVQ